MLNTGEQYSNRHSPIPSKSQETVQASLNLAHNYIAQGNTTAALQVSTPVVLEFPVLT